MFSEGRLEMVSGIIHAHPARIPQVKFDRQKLLFDITYCSGFMIKVVKFFVENHM